MTPVRRGDRARQLLTLAAAISQTALPVLLPPRFGPDELPPDVLQPAPATFAVWLPIFATSVVHAGLQAMPERADEPVLRAVGGPATVAYVATAIWAPLVRARRYWWAQGALFSIAGAAEIGRRRLATAETHGDLPHSVRLAVAPPPGMLAAWAAAASAVSVSASAGLLPVVAALANGFRAPSGTCNMKGNQGQRPVVTPATADHGGTRLAW